MGNLEHAIYMREWRKRNVASYRTSQKKYWKNHPEYRTKRRAAKLRRNPERERAVKSVWQAIRKGLLHRPDSCSRCHLKCSPQGHHEDYMKRLDVIWLCRKCHLAEHGKQLREIV